MKHIVKFMCTTREEKYVCSECGTIIVGPIVIANDSFWHFNWDQVPMKCGCGEQLTETKTVTTTYPVNCGIVVEE